MPRPARQQREIDQSQVHILRSAARVFAQKGFADATMQEIADDAGYSPPTLYSYFKGKQAIVDRLTEVMHAEWAAMFENPAPAAGLSFRQRLEVLLRAQYQWMDKNRDAFLFFIRWSKPVCEGGRSPHPTDWYVPRMAAWLAANAAPADLGGLDVQTAAFFLYGLQNSMGLRWVAQDQVQSLQSWIPLTLGLFFHGVAGAEAGPAGTHFAAAGVGATGATGATGGGTDAV